MSSTTYDVLIAGGGPGGATAALVLARAGLKVAVLEKDAHPRFHIGESILPRLELLLRELGISDDVRKLPHLPKYGAEFGFGNDPATMKFGFTDGLLPGFAIFNIERAHLDNLLIRLAREAGAEIIENTLVRSITRLEEGGGKEGAGGAGAVELVTSRGTFSGRLLLDCSGHGTVVARHLGNRRNLADPELQKVAYFDHYEGVEHLPGELAGHPGIFMAEEGWFWVIGLGGGKTSVGFVTRPSFTRQLNVPPDRLLRWAIDRCPVVRERMKNARPVASHDAARDAGGKGAAERNQVLADFSYTCSPHAGPGYFLVGDAGSFLDPIFSTGVTLAMVGANEAAKHAIAILRDRADARRARREYIRFVERSTGIFWRLIRSYYNHPFRELFMNGSGPMQVHKAVISILAGQVFPKPAWSLRWRLELFFLCMHLQKYLPLVPRRPRFSLLIEPPVTYSPPTPIPNPTMA